MPMYLKGAFILIKVPVIAKGMTGQTHSGLTVHNFDILSLWYTSLQGVPVHKAPNINTDSSPLGILCSFFLEIMHLLVEETHNGWTCLMNDTAHCFMWLHEMYLFLIIVLQMRHDQRHRLKNYWCKLEHFLHGLLWQHNETTQILPHTEISTF
jgi:hypothetical protein